MSAYASTSSSPFPTIPGAGAGTASSSPHFLSSFSTSSSPAPYRDTDPSFNSTTSTNYTPTTRSRTLLFISYRDSIVRSSKRRRLDAQHHHYPEHDEHEVLFNADAEDEDEQARLIGSSERDHHDHVSIDMDAKLPPKWVDTSDQVNDILAGTQSKMSALEKLHAKHVLPGFADRSAEEREIEAVTTDITRDFRRCQSLIQSIAASPPSSTFPPTRPSKHEQLAAQNVQRGLAAKVQALSATFRKKQRVYMETLQGHAIKNQDLLVASGAVTLKGAEGMSDLDEDVQIATHGQGQLSTLALQQQQGELAPAVDLQQRDREITEIARSIAQLAELFKDLSGLVIDQGTLLDSVEYNIEQTAVEMQEAVTELKIAEGYQRNTGRRKCILLLLLIIFGLTIVLVFKPRRHASATPVSTASGSNSGGSVGNAVSVVPSATAMNLASDPSLSPSPNLSSGPEPASASSQLPPLPILSIDLGMDLGFGPRVRSAVRGPSRRRDVVGGRSSTGVDAAGGDVGDARFSDEGLLFERPHPSPTLISSDNTRQHRPWSTQHVEIPNMYYPVG